jgi:PST family polysaccharide transporter
VISWPLGFILLAKGCRRLFLVSEVAGSVVHVAMLWWGVRNWGLPGTGMAFFGLYVVATIWILAMVRHESGFRWSRSNLRMLAWMLPAVGVVFVAAAVLPPVAGLVAGGTVTAVCGWVCLHGLLKRVPKHRLGWFARWAG